MGSTYTTAFFKEGSCNTISWSIHLRIISLLRFWRVISSSMHGPRVSILQSLRAQQIIATAISSSLASLNCGIFASAKSEKYSDNLFTFCNDFFREVSFIRWSVSDERALVAFSSVRWWFLLLKIRETWVFGRQNHSRILHPSLYNS